MCLNQNVLQKGDYMQILICHGEVCMSTNKMLTFLLCIPHFNHLERFRDLSFGLIERFYIILQMCSESDSL